MSPTTSLLRERLAQLTAPGAVANARREIVQANSSLDAVDRQLRSFEERQHRRAA